MKQPIIYHNPRCSKSRATLALLTERGYEPQIIEYLIDPPDTQTLKSLCARLGVAAKALVRSKEAKYSELQLASSDEQTLLQAIAEHPILLERPIVCMGERAAIGRPPENVLDILPASN
ncbi:MAG: arsenate reductase (glutaredoxin) [Pseudomonadales bacterium]